MSVAFSPDGRLLAASTAGRDIFLWNAGSGAQVARLDGHESQVGGIAFSPDGKLLASASDDRTLRLWDVASGEQVARLDAPAQLWSVAFSPDGRRVATGSEDRSIALWDVASGREATRFQAHESRVVSVAFSPDGTRLASSSEDPSVHLWEVGSAQDDAGEAAGIGLGRGASVEALYQASLYLLGYRAEGSELKPTARPLFLSPVGDYRFPRLRRYWKLDRPRPPGEDPVQWILEAAIPEAAAPSEVVGKRSSQ